MDASPEKFGTHRRNPVQLTTWMNAFVERFIQTLQQEVLDFFIVFGEQHMDHIVSEALAYYHECRPHQGIGNILLPMPRGEPDKDATETLPLRLDKIKCERRLGGLLKHYYHAA